MIWDWASHFADGRKPANPRDYHFPVGALQLIQCIHFYVIDPPRMITILYSIPVVPRKAVAEVSKIGHL